MYLSEDKLKVQILGCGFDCMDIGEIYNLINASVFIKNI